MSRDRDHGGGDARLRPVLEQVGPSSSCTAHVAAPSSGFIMATSLSEAPPEQTAVFQGTRIDRGSPEKELLGSAPPITATSASSLKGPFGFKQAGGFLVGRSGPFSGLPYAYAICS